VNAISSSVNAPAPSAAAQDQVRISPIAQERVLVPIVGTNPLIVHNFSAKSRQMMLDAMQGKKSPATKKDPEAEYNDAFYRMENGEPGFPAIGFKACTVGAARFYGKDVKMTELRQFMFFRGILSDRDPMPLVQIIGEPEMREDTVRVGMGKADLRYRPMFRQWSATLDITYVTSQLDLDSLVSLVNAGGMGVGVGEWRPEKRGEFGTFALDVNHDIEIIRGE
jgi:hypothetical protein